MPTFILVATLGFFLLCIIWNTKIWIDIFIKFLLGCMAAWGLWILCGSPRIHAP